MDLNPRSPDLLMSILKGRMKFAVPLHYIGFPADQIEETWMQQLCIDKLIELIEKGTLQCLEWVLLTKRFLKIDWT